MSDETATFNHSREDSPLSPCKECASRMGAVALRDAIEDMRDVCNDERGRVATARAEVAALRGLLGRAVKYATEDRMQTPGVTRLARLIDEARAALATNPVPPGAPDPTSGAGEPQPGTKCGSCRNPATRFDMFGPSCEDDHRHYCLTEECPERANQSVHGRWLCDAHAIRWLSQPSGDETKTTCGMCGGAGGRVVGTANGNDRTFVRCETCHGIGTAPASGALGEPTKFQQAVQGAREAFAAVREGRTERTVLVREGGRAYEASEDEAASGALGPVKGTQGNEDPPLPNVSPRCNTSPPYGCPGCGAMTCGQLDPYTGRPSK